MATMFDDVLAKLEAATTSILTGGIYKSDAIDNASNGGYVWAKDQGLVVNTVMTPHGILRWKDATAHQTNARHIRASMQTAELYMYADYGNYALLESTIKPIQDAFPVGEIYSADDRQLYDVMQIDAFGELPTEEYQNRPSRMIRLMIVQKR